jgi:hypothetical protein
MPRKQSLIPAERIERAILVLRGHKVILDADLAGIYGVTTARLNQQVRRNRERFPEDFAFLLTPEEFADLKLHIATSSSGWGGRRKLPFAFTEHGAVMAASVLNTPIAVAASIQVVRAFVRLRQLLVSHVELTRKLDELEAKYAEQDKKLVAVFEALRQLMAPPQPPKQGRIGFQTPPSEPSGTSTVGTTRRRSHERGRIVRSGDRRAPDRSSSS